MGQPAKIFKLDVVNAALEPSPIPPEDLVSGAPEAHWAVMWRSEDGRLFNGVWHCTPGAFYLDGNDETVCLIEGRATVTPEGGASVQLEAGDTAFLPEGTRNLWEVEETVKKAFHHHDASGQILASVE
jgi:uncharacterized cupin superfamily protein